MSIDEVYSRRLDDVRSGICPAGVNSGIGTANVTVLLEVVV